jgi:hypothetical protein
MIRRLEDDQTIGFIELDGIDWRLGMVGSALALASVKIGARDMAPTHSAS